MSGIDRATAFVRRPPEMVVTTTWKSVFEHCFEHCLQVVRWVVFSWNGSTIVSDGVGSGPRAVIPFIEAMWHTGGQSVIIPVNGHWQFKWHLVAAAHVLNQRNSEGVFPSELKNSTVTGNSSGTLSQRHTC